MKPPPTTATEAIGLDMIFSSEVPEARGRVNRSYSRKSHAVDLGRRRALLMAQEPGLARAVVDEAVHADLLILGGEKGGEMKLLDLEAGVETDF